MSETQRPDPLELVRSEDTKQDGDTRCDVQRPVLFGAAARCPGAGILRIWFGCVNEHVGLSDLCTVCAPEVLLNFPAACARCARAGAPGRSVIIRHAFHSPAAEFDKRRFGVLLSKARHPAGLEQ